MTQKFKVPKKTPPPTKKPVKNIEIEKTTVRQTNMYQNKGNQQTEDNRETRINSVNRIRNSSFKFVTKKSQSKISKKRTFQTKGQRNIGNIRKKLLTHKSCFYR